MMRRSALCTLSLVILAGSCVAAEAARPISKPVAELLTKAATAEPADVVRLIDGWSGDAHPLLLLSRAQARWRLAQDAQATQHGPGIAAAEQDFRAALVLDATLNQAHLGLAQCAAEREDWLTASRESAAGIDPATADQGLLTFLASTALRAGDWRLATLTAQHGIMRFPDDAQLRRLELEVLIHAGRSEDVRQSVLALLIQTPTDADLWRYLAWAARETGRNEESLGALEAALAVKPADPALRRQLAEAQIARDLPQAALHTVRPLVGEPPNATVLSNAPLMLLASRAAAAAGELTQARAWLAAIPEAARTRELRLQTARLAVQAGDGAAAGAALEGLVQLGERDAAVLTWAGSLADGRGDLARAEALYLQAVGAGGPAASAASLRLAAFYIKQNRRDEAQTTLASYLVNKPDDVQARALQAQLDRKAKP